MSRCKACDVILSEYELKKKDTNTGGYLDLCGECARHSNAALMDSYSAGYSEEEFIFDNEHGN
tara:strand:+ start:936 stop:1124 length:189 start_codon:yes stop_codon:yes gene_type:complete